MFYVIGSEESKSGSAFFLLPPTEPKAWWRSSALPVYRYRVGWNRQIMSQCGRTFLFSCYVAVYRCAIIIQIMRYAVKVASPLAIFGISKGKFQRLQKISLYLLGHFQEKYQRAKNNSVQLGQNFQNPLPTMLVGSLKPHFCPSWTEVKNHFYATCREVWLQLLHRLCRS